MPSIIEMKKGTRWERLFHSFLLNWFALDWHSDIHWVIRIHCELRVDCYGYKVVHIQTKIKGFSSWNCNNNAKYGGLFDITVH